MPFSLHSALHFGLECLVFPLQVGSPEVFHIRRFSNNAKVLLPPLLLHICTPSVSKEQHIVKFLAIFTVFIKQSKLQTPNLLLELLK